MLKSNARKEIQRDRATIRKAADTLKDTKSTTADKSSASQAIVATVLKTTGLRATENSPQMLADLTAALVDSPTPILAGIEAAIALKAPSAEVAASIPPKVIDRLKKLV